ncbi:hypothetical protein HELRODRAFT_171806 [Helobdella robusta]|uniref:Uncharacterized protein n=1 Tax=Helobdella robusta TaxID=6412 RepID=T1F4P7_HELRO|nr:hypothetical protein HELRODRAFT_171806 [Helobdella robusta]ESO05407.1 hypothetical protein HELRODRAFT_171806 [Helobdella robusta]
MSVLNLEALEVTSNTAGLASARKVNTLRLLKLIPPPPPHRCCICHWWIHLTLKYHAWGKSFKEAKNYKYVEMVVHFDFGKLISDDNNNNINYNNINNNININSNNKNNINFNNNIITHKNLLKKKNNNTINNNINNINNFNNNLQSYDDALFHVDTVVTPDSDDDDSDEMKHHSFVEGGSSPSSSKLRTSANHENKFYAAASFPFNHNIPTVSSITFISPIPSLAGFIMANKHENTLANNHTWPQTKIIRS